MMGLLAHGSSLMPGLHLGSQNAPPGTRSPPLPRNSTAWLPGFCGLTTGKGDCASGAKGAWRLPNLGPLTLAAAKRRCVKKCHGCARCNYVSVSAHHQDCSWFHACELPRLEQEPCSFQTTWMDAAAAPVPRTYRPMSAACVDVTQSQAWRRRQKAGAAAYQALAVRSEAVAAAVNPQAFGPSVAAMPERWIAEARAASFIGQGDRPRRNESAVHLRAADNLRWLSIGSMRQPSLERRWHHAHVGTVTLTLACTLTHPSEPSPLTPNSDPQPNPNPNLHPNTLHPTPSASPRPISRLRRADRPHSICIGLVLRHRNGPAYATSAKSAIPRFRKRTGFAPDWKYQGHTMWQAFDVLRELRACGVAVHAWP